MNMASVSHIRSYALPLTIHNINQPQVLLRIDDTTRDNEINAFVTSFTSILSEEGASLRILTERNLTNGKYQ